MVKIREQNQKEKQSIIRVHIGVIGRRESERKKESVLTKKIISRISSLRVTFCTLLGQLLSVELRELSFKSVENQREGKTSVHLAMRETFSSGVLLVVTHLLSKSVFSDSLLMIRSSLEVCPEAVPSSPSIPRSLRMRELSLAEREVETPLFVKTVSSPEP